MPKQVRFAGFVITVTRFVAWKCCLLCIGIVRATTLLVLIKWAALPQLRRGDGRQRCCVAEHNQVCGHQVSPVRE